MPRLENFSTAQQANNNSCWACAGREINNFFCRQNRSGTNEPLNSDHDFASACDMDVNVQLSAAEALHHLGYKNNVDERPIPTPTEITKAIAEGTPLLSIVGSKDPGLKPDLNYKKGHWVVIIGISDDLKTLYVFDPDTGQVQKIPYNQKLYQEGVYWENTSYVDGQ